MKSVYLENTNNHHDKFYHMIENKDGASFTASWGRIGMNGLTHIYGINEWDKKYQEKINKGYKDTTNVTPPSNWIQGMSVAQRKKQGITTVMPSKPKKKIDKKIHYDVGQVDVEVDHSHINKLRILHMTMHLWKKNNGQLPMDSQRCRLYDADLHKVEKLVERGTETMLESDTEFLGTDQFLTKEEMIDMNILFKTYGGKRVTQ
jgi:predicted DNA-binding WGR domain protein